MSTNENSISEKTPSGCPSIHNPVRVFMQDTIGAVFLGIFAVICLIGWMRSAARHRELLTKQESIHGNR